MTSDFWVDIRDDNRWLGQRIREVRTAQMMSQPELIDFINQLGPFTAWDNPALSRIEGGGLIPYPALAEALSSWLILNSEPESLLIGPPSARRTDPDTSHAAARSVTSKTLRELHHWWLTHLYNMSLYDLDELTVSDIPNGYYTTDEGARTYYHGETSDSGFRTRRSELCHAGLVTDSGLRYPISTGRYAISWELTPTGYRALQETP